MRRVAVILGEVVGEYVHPIAGVEVLRMRGTSQGVGGDQKLAFLIALERGADWVIPVMRPDVPAELVERLIEAARASEADAVLAGGEPATSLENRLAGVELASWRPPAVAYSAALLKRVPFEINDNDERFDVQLLLQAAYVGARFQSVAFDTRTPRKRHRGEFFRFWMHRQGMICSLRYRNLSPVSYPSKVDIPYTSHAMALELVRRIAPKKLLDLGCGPGFVARECERMGMEVMALDAAEPAPGMVSHFERFNLDEPELPVDALAFDVVLLLDVVEHLKDPEFFLFSLRHRGRGAGGGRPRVILSTPNIAFVTMRIGLLFGRFNYAARGILDIDHKRLFTRASLRRMLDECGYEIESIRPVPVPFGAVVGGRAGRVLGKIAAMLARVWPTMFAFQWLVVCRPRAGVGQVTIEFERRRSSVDPTTSNTGSAAGSGT